jgi:hypothetical protein
MASRVSQAKRNWLVTQQARIDDERKKLNHVRQAFIKSRQDKIIELETANIDRLKYEITLLKQKGSERRKRQGRQVKAGKVQPRAGFGSSSAYRFDTKSMYWQPGRVGSNEDDWTIETQPRGASTSFGRPKKVVNKAGKHAARTRRTSCVLGSQPKSELYRQETAIRRHVLKKIVKEETLEEQVASIKTVRALRKHLDLGLSSDEKRLLRQLESKRELTRADVTNFLAQHHAKDETTCERKPIPTFVGSLPFYAGKWGEPALPTRPKVMWHDREKLVQNAGRCVPKSSSEQAFTRFIFDKKEHQTNNRHVPCSKTHRRPKSASATFRSHSRSHSHLHSRNNQTESWNNI